MLFLIIVFLFVAIPLLMSGRLLRAFEENWLSSLAQSKEWSAHYHSRAMRKENQKK